ncbi:DUF2157 domain-containing protein [Aquabacterium sp.]|uniref:DUF2157 domain-containing protein n=1 Tax=Aquabacterium sp. TaxID=1872578 RepID=UPI0025B9E633|nr:DUF2157 domain-containing protein [Aquabacterium sp.]
MRREDRPTPAERRAFAVSLLQAAGLGSLGAGIIFFVAANWPIWGLAGRFGSLETGLVLCIGVALRQPPPLRTGQAALLLATFLTGALLALFGQSYQTGADVHELFFTWALLALPFAVAALSGAVWAVWWVVLDVGLALLCGGLGLDHFFWRFLEGWGRDRGMLLMLPCLVNLLGAGFFPWLRRSAFAKAAPLWLVRLLLTIGLGYGVAASLPDMTEHGEAIIGLYALISIAIAGATLAHRLDVFPLTVLAGCWIAISTVWMAHAMGLNDVGQFFIITVWLTGSSAAAAKLLMHLLHQWRDTAEGGAAS